jgi:predicted DNA-binding protein (MmcQ/YjbR family)
MEPKASCRMCGVEFLARTAAATDGLCRRCVLVQRSNRPIVKTIREYCLQQPGAIAAYEGGPIGIFSASHSEFAHIGDWLEVPKLLLRCRNEALDGLLARHKAIRPISEETLVQFDGLYWLREVVGEGLWGEVTLDGSVGMEEVSELIDDSYRLSVESASDESRFCLSLMARDIPLTELLGELIAALGLSSRRDQILGLGVQAFLLKAAAAGSAEVGTGSSRLGGLPDLPPGVTWPVHGAGKPLTFLAQFNLADLPAGSPLPSSGLLSFFSVYGWQNERGEEVPLPEGKYNQTWTRVYYHDVPSKALARLTAPAEVNVFPAANVEFIPFICFPSHPSEPAMARCKWSTAIKERYLTLIGIYNLFVTRRVGTNLRTILLGYANYQQDFVRQVAKRDMRLLFQLDSDHNAGMGWGDDGCIYFWLPAGDLVSACFDDILTDSQCG